MTSAVPLVAILAETKFEIKFCLATEFESIFLKESETLYSVFFRQDEMHPETPIRSFDLCAARDKDELLLS